MGPVRIELTLLASVIETIVLNILIERAPMSSNLWIYLKGRQSYKRVMLTNGCKSAK